MHKFKFDYDSENDILFIFDSKKKSKGSIEIGKLILDFSSKKKLVGIEIIDASDFLASADKAPLKNMLSDLRECKVGIQSQNNLILIKLLLISQQKETLIPIYAPNISKPSPSLGY